ncbi:MAG: GMC family oxidoreductase [Candidatus Eremiobacteraeota bacterium]|nr:GMC family oxidoreductase [Candidatus Eremiobacteraeota bacterium]
MNPGRRLTLRAVVATFAPPDARVERVTELAVLAIDGLTPGRRTEFEQLLDLLALPMKAGEAIRAGTLKLLADSPIPKLRTGFAALKRLTLFLSYAESEPPGSNPTWKRIGYPGPRHDRPVPDIALPLSVGRDGERLTADVVVIGSGAGGGVAASAFARAGKRVIVLEGGDAFDASTFAQRELAMSQLYLDGGLTATDDLGIAILAGATLGGGTTVNWCTSFRLPDRIAAEWAAQSGIAALGNELAPHFDALERELQLAPARAHNANNRAILDGARALGLHGDAMPRNASPDCGDGCGYCGYGCAYGNKRSTPRQFLPDVAANGGAIYAGAHVERIDIAGARATSVRVAQTTSDGNVRRFDVAGDLIVVAAGTLRTPGLLARSGVRHPLLGKRLFLHPVAGLFPEYDRPIEAWHGPMQSAYSDAYAYRAGNYGAKIEVAPTHPGLAALALPWVGRAAHASALGRARYGATFIAVTRDRDPGAIDLDDEAAIRYRISPFDGENLLGGVIGMIDIAFAGGAERVTTLHNRPLVIARDGWTTARRAELARDLQRIGVASNRQIFFSAHQMGTAAMGSDPRTSVVDPDGAVWGYDNLLVVDASVFPQASGVNPMLSVMAMAARIAARHGGTLEHRTLARDAVHAAHAATAVS